MKTVYFDYRGWKIASQFIFDKNGKMVPEINQVDTSFGKGFEVVGEKSFIDTLIELVNDSPE